MSNEVNMTRAKEIFDKMCSMFDHNELKYGKDEEKLVINCGMSGEDIPMQFIMVVNPSLEIVSYISWLPFKISEDKRVDAAIAVNVANYGLSDGSFDYDISDGEIRFRLTSSYRESDIGESMFEYMMMIATKTVDDYNDKFLMLNKGIMTLEQFIEAEKKS